MHRKRRRRKCDTADGDKTCFLLKPNEVSVRRRDFNVPLIRFMSAAAKAKAKRLGNSICKILIEIHFSVHSLNFLHSYIEKIEQKKILKCGKKAFDCWPTIFFLLFPPLKKFQTNWNYFSYPQLQLVLFSVNGIWHEPKFTSLKWKMLLESSIENARGWQA